MTEFEKNVYDRVSKKLQFSENYSEQVLYGIIDAALSEVPAEVSVSDKLRARARVFSALRRLDLLSVIMDDPEVTEIMINGTSQVFIEKQGKLYEYPERFDSEERLLNVVRRIVSDVNRSVTMAEPMADARLSDGSRVNIVLPPVALDGPVVTVRRFRDETLSMENLIAMGSITDEAAAFLDTVVKAGYNIFVSGGTGAGKTTFLGALAGSIPPESRVVTIEDAAELKIRSVKNLVRLEARPGTLDGKNEVTIRDLLKNALRMRPDRIIVGEVRGKECLDMLTAMNTGHDGSLSTGHANSAEDMLTRLETMVLMAMDLPLPAVRQMIASGLDIMVHVGRRRDGSRKVLGIYEVCGVKNGKIRLVPLFEYSEGKDPDGQVKGRLRRTGNRLANRENLLSCGLAIPYENADKT